MCEILGDVDLCFCPPKFAFHITVRLHPTSTAPRGIRVRLYQRNCTRYITIIHNCDRCPIRRFTRKTGASEFSVCNRHSAEHSTYRRIHGPLTIRGRRLPRASPGRRFFRRVRRSCFRTRSRVTHTIPVPPVRVFFPF